MNRCALLLPALMLSHLCPTMAIAQPEPNDGWRFGVGGGALVSPTYEGDDNYRVSALPNIQIEYGTRFSASVQNGVRYEALQTDRFTMGPIARIRFSRNEDGSQPFAITGERTTDLRGLGDVATTIELGGFANYDFGPVSASVEARHAVNGHDGLVVDAGLRYGGQTFALGPPLIFSVGPRVKIVDENYNQSYFGVTPVQALASGLPVYNADGGLQSYGVGATLILPLTRDNSASVVFIAGYDRLTGDAGDAPLVRLRGDRDQATLGLFFTYWFQ